MKLSLPQFQFRFVPSMGNVIHPGNFHPVGAQVAARRMIETVKAAGDLPKIDQPWLIVGGSGGFGSAVRSVLGAGCRVPTLNISYEAQPNPQSNNKIRKLGSPGFHRSLALERSFASDGIGGWSINGDVFDPAVQQHTIDEIRAKVGQIGGLVWSLAAPRAVDPRTGNVVASSLKPVGRSAKVKTFSGRDPARGEHSQIGEVELPPGSPEEAIRTIYVMGGGIVAHWIELLLEADVVAPGFRLLTISYRGSPLNESVYRKGLIGLAKADLEFQTAAIDHILQRKVGGRAFVVEGPAVVTEASGGIPGVPFYMAHLLEVLGDRFEEPIQVMLRLFREHLGESGPKLDPEGLIRIDDRELAEDVQAEMAARFEKSAVGDAFPEHLYDRFMQAYGMTRGFSLEGIDYEAEFDTDEVCS